MASKSPPPSVDDRKSSTRGRSPRPPSSAVPSRLPSAGKSQSPSRSTSPRRAAGDSQPLSGRGSQRLGRIDSHQAAAGNLQAPKICDSKEARFKALAEKRPRPTDDEIKRELAKDPPLDKFEYHGWARSYRAAEVRKLFYAPPRSSREAASLLKRTMFNDYKSVGRLGYEAILYSGFQKMPFGHYSSEVGEIFCYLDLNIEELPQDLPRNSRGWTDGTHLTCIPTDSRLPKMFHQIGHLCLSTTDDVKKAQASDFFVVVTPQRKVYAIWNPLGPEPDYTYDDDGVTSTTHINRPVGGRLLGFKPEFTAVKLADNIDFFCQSRPAGSLDISPEKFIVLDPKSTLLFTGIRLL